jgi:hypothetical protein
MPLMALAGSRIGLVLIAALLPMQAGFQSKTPSTPTRAATPAHQSAHDKNWLKKQVDKRYNAPLTTPKKADKPAKTEEKPTESTRND